MLCFQAIRVLNYVKTERRTNLLFVIIILDFLIVKSTRMHFEKWQNLARICSNAVDII